MTASEVEMKWSWLYIKALSPDKIVYVAMVISRVIFNRWLLWKKESHQL